MRSGKRGGWSSIIRRYYGQKRAREGGPGSGHWGHAGRPGKLGGSAPGRGRRFAEKEIVAAWPLNGGTSVGEVLEYDDGSSAIWKEDDGGGKYELAAYGIDRLLGLGVVPHTERGRNSFGELGTVQKFVEGKVGAEYVASYHEVPSARAKGVNWKDELKIGVLDRIRNEQDRHSYNYIVESNGRIKAIDNEWGRFGAYGRKAPFSPFYEEYKGSRIPEDLLKRWRKITKDEWDQATYGADDGFGWNKFNEIRYEGRLV